MIYIKLMAILAPLMLAIDAVWIGFLMKGFYTSHLGYIMRTDINLAVAVVFYFLYIFGLLYFVVIPAGESDKLANVFVSAALFGLIAYGTYDLTNHATLQGWPWIVTVVDMTWGALLTGILGVIGFLLMGVLGQ